MATLGLIGTLNMGTQSLQTQQMGVEVAGHNLANINNPNYSRQRIEIETSVYFQTPIGPEGTGAEVVAIKQLRDQLLDDQITSERSLSGSLSGQQKALQYAQANLGQQIDRQAAGANAADTATSLAGQFGLAEGISTLFNSFQSVASSPRDATERTVLLENAKSLAAKFTQTDDRLNKLTANLDDSIDSDVVSANNLLRDIAKLTDEIEDAENRTSGAANDLRDKRQGKVEELAKLVNISLSRDSAGVLSISVGSTTLVSGKTVQDTLESYDAGGGQMLIRTATAHTALNVTGGSIGGTITARDGALSQLKQDINSLATLMISEINTVHAAGYSLTGTTGANFFTGTDAGDIAVNTALTGNPQLVQASSSATAQGNNQVALQLAQLADKKHASLAGRTFSQNFNGIVSDLGQALSNVNSEKETQDVVESMLNSQRDSLMGVSIDEEMTNLIKYQKAYQASARIITTIDEMLETVLSLKR